MLVVDDQPVFRAFARELLDTMDDFTWLDEAASGRQALALADSVEPDLVLLDVWMEGIDGLATAHALHAAHPDAVVVLVSVSEKGDLPPGTASCGATATVRKRDLSPAVLRRLWRKHRP